MERLTPGVALKRGDRETLAVMFSSRVAPKLVEFDFLNFAQRSPQTFLLLRDETAHLYYHQGIAGLGTGIADTAVALQRLVSGLGPRRVVMAGSSMGAYAALLFGLQIGADAVVAINGLSYLDEDLARRRGGGERVPRSFGDLRGHYTSRRRAPEYLDLRSEIDRLHGTPPVVRWHYGTQDPIDALHADHLDGAPGVTLIPHRAVREHAMLPLRLVTSGLLNDEIAGDYAPADPAPKAPPATGAADP